MCDGERGPLSTHWPASFDPKNKWLRRENSNPQVVPKGGRVGGDPVEYCPRAEHTLMASVPFAVPSRLKSA